MQYGDRDQGEDYYFYTSFHLNSNLMSLYRFTEKKEKSVIIIKYTYNKLVRESCASNRIYFCSVVVKKEIRWDLEVQKDQMRPKNPPQHFKP